MTFKRAPLVLISLLVTARLVYAQPAPVRLTLVDAVRQGLDASYRLAELGARQSATRAAVEAAQSENRPYVAFVAGYTRTNHIDPFGVVQPGGLLRVIYPDVPDNYRTRLDLQWPVYTGGRVEALTRATNEEAEASSQDVSALRADLRLEITRAYWAVVTVEESVKVVREAVRRVESHLSDMRSRLSAGLVPPNEVLSVNAQRSREQALLIEAETTRDVAVLALKRLLRLDPEAPLELDARLEEPSASPPASDVLVAEARRSRADRQALAQRVAAAGERKAAAAAGRQPAVIVAAGYDYARPNPRIFPREPAWNDSWDLSVNLSWSLFDGGRVRAAMAEAAANEQAVGYRLEEFDSLLDLEVRQRRLDLESARAAIGASTDAVRSAAEARRVVAERFGAGVATSTEVLDAQVALLEAELERTRALAATRLADARLERAVGR